MYEIDFSEWPIRGMNDLGNIIYDYLSFQDKEYDDYSNIYFEAYSALSRIAAIEKDVDEINDCMNDILQYESIYAVMKGLKMYFSEGYTSALSDEEINDIIDIEAIPLSKTYIQLNQQYEELKNNFKKHLFDEVAAMYNNFSSSEENYRRYNLHASFREIMKILKATDDMCNSN